MIVNPIRKTKKIKAAVSAGGIKFESGGSGRVGESQGSQLGAQVGSDVIRGAREDEATREWNIKIAKGVDRSRSTVANGTGINKGVGLSIVKI